MASRYEPKDHIQHLEVAPRAEILLDQREITIQSYQTTVLFDIDALKAGIDSAWLTPQIPFGVFAHEKTKDHDSLNVVLGLQDSVSVRAYDYEERRPLWYSWQNAIVDTVNVHYYRDENDLLRFTATGGGRRITEERLNEFNEGFLKIPKAAVSKRHFDLDKLREMCFKRFINRLYVVRFSDPSGDEYRSIDHAQFQSREYIDPLAERLQEIHTDPQVKIESFDSDIEVASHDLAAPVRVRFFIRGLSGSLRLRFPTMNYRSQLKTAQEQARVAYRIVDATVNLILDADYYTQQHRSLEELDTNVGIFPDMVNLVPFREVLIEASAREEFFQNIDIGAFWNAWLPHLRTLDELIASDAVRSHVVDLIDELVGRDPGQAIKLLLACNGDPKLAGVGLITAEAVTSQLQAIPSEMRPHAEEALVAWSLDHETESWQVDVETGTITVFAALRWKVQDFAPELLAKIVWKLVGLLHNRLTAATGDCGSALRQFQWCMTIAKTFPPQQTGMTAGLRLVAEGKAPRTVADSAHVLKAPVGDLRALDSAILDQFGLAMWPSFRAYRDDGKAILENDGIGAAIGVRIVPAGMLFGDDGGGKASDILSGDSIAMPAGAELAAVDVRFEKFGREYCIAVPLADKSPDGSDQPGYVPVLERIEAGVRQIGSDIALLPPVVAAVGRNVDAVLQTTTAIAKNEYELRQENAELRELAKGGILQFATRIKADDFRAFAAVMLAGNRSKAAQCLGIPQRTFYDRVDSWLARGPDYRRMHRMVEWRKKSLRKIKVRLDDSLLGTEIDGQAENPETIRDVLAAIRDGDDARSHDDLLRDILQAIINQNPGNWQSIRAELVEILEGEVTPQ
jgi:hypothetical protein